MVAVEDISQAKRLAVLRRTFFHDVLNTAGCIQGYARYLATSDAGELEAHAELGRLADQLVEDIQAQRDLIYAELGDFQVQMAPVDVVALLQDIRLQYARHPVAEDRSIRLTAVWDGLVISDRQLLMRVLGNMLKNALEATGPCGVVSLGCTAQGNLVTFAVSNAEVMPEDVQLQIFQRSFSTKETNGRGVGTYSMKLFGERYLGGKVDFTSLDPDGTTFTLTIPKRPPAGGK
jgi:signal transduction histidine kinase